MANEPTGGLSGPGSTSGTVLLAVRDAPTRGELLTLYESVGWTAYTSDPAMLERAVAGSSYLVTARRDGVLIGLARAISDDATMCYLQDILVAPRERRTGGPARRAGLSPHHPARCASASRSRSANRRCSHSSFKMTSRQSRTG